MVSSSVEQNWGVTESSELFKTDFKEYAEATYNKDILLWSQIEKPAMTGDETEFPAPFGYNGGNSSGSLPAKRSANYNSIKFTHKKVYAAADVERDAMAASMSSKGAFVQFMEEPMKKIQEGFTWNMTRILHGNGDGSLGAIATSGVTDNGGGNYTLVLSSPKIANFEEDMLVNIETGNTDLFVIQSVDPDNLSIVVQRESGGTQVPAQTDTIFMQKSENNDPFGLKYVTDADGSPVSSLYNVSIGRRWKSYQENASSKAITPQLFNKVLLRQEARVGKKNAPKFGLASYIQYEKLLNQLEDSKRYDVIKKGPKDKNLHGVVGFDGIVIHATNGPFELFPERFVEDDRLYLLNLDFIEAYTMPKSGFVTDDTGKPFLRSQDEDKFEIRWAWYGQIYIAPQFQAVIHTLSTT